jgi:ParB family chromosome partitioning protein
MIEKKRGLGRSLQDLLSPADWLKRDDIQLFYCHVDNLKPNPYQPRQVIHDAQMDELVQSIREKGVLQPILVSKTGLPDTYQILAGERRWQASRLAGLTEIPVILRDTTSAEALELALIENIQRRDLNCVEEALAYQRLQEEFDLTQEEIAQRVAKNRSTVANLIRLLALPPEIQEDILNERLTMGHARALLTVENSDQQRALRDLIISRQLSVRQAEALAKNAKEPKKILLPQEPRWFELQESLQTHLRTKVLLRSKGDRGTITISFASRDELDRLLQYMGMAKPT